MFNFHKPRTYRSVEGCCICRAKSSSSRFTDSRKYERDTIQCFDLKYPRQGEICNACVLLVKRFKRLPVGSKRNWSHVVDARAGPGGSKIQTKYKSERVNSRTQQHNSSWASPVSSGSCTSNGSPNSTVNGQQMPFIPEKFSKIFKKSKKVKESSSSSSLSSSHSSTKRKSSSNGWSNNALHSLPSTPDSQDSDYEDSRVHSSLGGCGPGTVVQFQTQTRASAFRAQAAAEARRRALKLGSKRRKCLQPRKNRRTTTYEETLQFFDEEEWREQKSCCGMLYECPALGGALIIDLANYKPCEKHQKSTTSAATIEGQQPSAMSTQRPILHHSIPAVVQLQPPTQPATSMVSCASLSTSSSSTSACSPITLETTSSITPSALTITKSTPVLKKHHLFFKRQSECFPQGDMVTQGSETTATTNFSSSSNSVNTTKTESDYNNRTQQHQLASQSQQQHQFQHPHNQSTTIFQRHNEHAIHSSAAPTNYVAVSSSGALSISVTSVGAPSSSSSSVAMPMSSSMPSSSQLPSTMPQMPKHSLAKVTTISPPLTASHTTINTSMPLPKTQSFLHKIKADTGKIVKHSLEKLNTAVRVKTSDIHDMKPIIKTVDKSYILAKPPTMANISTLNNAPAGAVTTYQNLSTYNSAAQPPLTTASLSAASPTSSTSSTSSTKFSDNSSDSGFDENMLDRKSASPLQEDCEKKLLSRAGVQTMFLASGVQIQGQPQNLVLTGNEVAAKILQNRKYSSITTTPVTSNTRAISTNHHHPTTTAVKIAQISTGNTTGGHHHSGATSTIMSTAAQAKMRAIYNNSNTIQHENGITTIVPASSLAATTQTAAMQNIAPSTVTITPAPPVGATQYNAQNIISRKLTAANLINLQSNNLSNTTTTNGGSNHLNTAANASNQKIILLKTSSANNNPISATLSSVASSSPLSMSSSSSSSASMSTATVTKYNGIR